MLVQQKFNPERRTGWNLVESSDPQYKAQITGIKIVNIFNFYLNVINLGYRITYEFTYYSHFIDC